MITEVMVMIFVFSDKSLSFCIGLLFLYFYIIVHNYIMIIIFINQVLVKNNILYILTKRLNILNRLEAMVMNGYNRDKKQFIVE